MRFSEMSSLFQDVQACAFLLLLVLIIMVFVRGRSCGFAPGLLWADAALVLGCQLLFSSFALTTESQARYKDIPHFHIIADILPDAVWLAFGLFVFVYAAWKLWATARWQRTHLSSMSVKEAMDDLPSGAVFFDDEGRSVLVNRVMNEICTSLTGSALIDRGVLEHIVAEAGGGPVTLSDGRSFSFSSRKIALPEGDIYGYTAADVSEEYKLSLELAENNRRLEGLLERYRELADLIEQAAMEKEILKAKISVHDDWGSALIATRRFLEGSSMLSENEVRDLWRENVRMMRGGAPAAAAEDGCETLLRAAGDVGLDLVIDGDLPEEEPARRIALRAIHECMTNALRHARADRLDVRITAGPDCWTLALFNNGLAPAGPVRETGGLKDLREEIERSGGRMSITYDPRFTVSLMMPKGGTLYV